VTTPLSGKQVEGVGTEILVSRVGRERSMEKTSKPEEAHSKKSILFGKRSLKGAPPLEEGETTGGYYFRKYLKAM